MAAQAQPGGEPRVFRIFISYASEDLPIALAIGGCLKIALGDYFAEVNLDRWFLQPGTPFKKQIESKLHNTDVLIIVYTGAEKQSHSFTGWEVGYFDRVMETDPERLKIAIYLDNPPAVSADEQGIPLGIGSEKLAMTVDAFESQLVVRPDEAICVLLEKWQEQVGKIIEGLRLPKPGRRPEQEAAVCVKNLKMAIFRYLKGTVETTVKPQRQVTVRVKGAALEQAIDSLPLDAELRPVSGGKPLEIFGLQDEPITWEKFLVKTAGNRLRDSWRDAITTVVMSSFPDRVNVDNSQIVLSSDEKTAYRLILTTATKYYDDYREFNVYLVQMVDREDYGDESTSLILKGLQLVCRFRFMFLESESKFSSGNILFSPLDRIPELAATLAKELNLLRKDAREAKLDEPSFWKRFVTWEHIATMSAEYSPREAKLRDIVSKIASAKGQTDTLTQLRKELAGVLEEMETVIRPENALLMKEMTRKLEEMVQEADEKAPAQS